MQTNLPNKSNTCIVIVTYNPDSSFINNLGRHLEIAEKIVVVDNNSAIAITSIIPEEYLNKINIIQSETNKGIAWALNVGIKEAIKLGFKQAIIPKANMINQSNTDLGSITIKQVKFLKEAIY